MWEQLFFLGVIVLVAAYCIGFVWLWDKGTLFHRGAAIVSLLVGIGVWFWPFHKDTGDTVIIVTGAEVTTPPREGCTRIIDVTTDEKPKAINWTCPNNSKH